MSFNVKFEVFNNYLSVKMDTLPTVEEVDTLLSDFLRSGKFAPNTNILYDLTTVSADYIDGDLIRKYVSAREKYPERGSAKIAMLVASKVAYGLSRMYELLSEKLRQRIMVFDNRDEAVRWVQESSLTK